MFELCSRNWPYQSTGRSSFGPTLCRLTARGTAMPWFFPNVLIHIHRALWMRPAIISDHGEHRLAVRFTPELGGVICCDEPR